jgi:hypothetical protein
VSHSTPHPPDAPEASDQHVIPLGASRTADILLTWRDNDNRLHSQRVRVRPGDTDYRTVTVYPDCPMKEVTP